MAILLLLASALLRRRERPRPSDLGAATSAKQPTVASPARTSQLSTLNPQPSQPTSDLRPQTSVSSLTSGPTSDLGRDSSAKQPTDSQLSTLNSQRSGVSSPQSTVHSPVDAPTSDLRPPTSAKQPTDSQLSTLNPQLSGVPSLQSAASRACFWLAIAVLLICGNGWVVKYTTRHLERQYPPLSLNISAKQPTDSQPSTLNSQLSEADAIVVLGGGQWPKLPPRNTVEVGEAGDRLLYAAYLYRHGMAPVILCTAGNATGALPSTPEADVMAEFLQDIGLPPHALLRETASRNTHEHARNLQSILNDHGFNRVLLVTSALHMPRAMGVFKKNCPGIEFIPAPTDYRVVDRPLPLHREIILSLIPTPTAYVQFSETMHEYLGILWYKLRGWM